MSSDKKINNFSIDLDNDTKEQFDHCCNQNYVTSASLMADAHKGYVAPIGSVLITKNYIVPSWVGYDIGCGMIACKFEGVGLVDKVRENASLIYDRINKIIPMGKGKVNHISNVSSKTKQEFKKILNRFSEGKFNEQVFRYLKNKSLSHLGSLGSGNHFIELCFFEGELWLVVHSGSRGVGHTVATHYMKESSGNDSKFEETFPLKDDSKLGLEYLNILEFGLDFALLNRLEMAYKVREVLREVIKVSDLDFELWVNKNHNHCIKIDSDLENNYYVHRKGATPANKGERGVIPANMRDGSFLVEGLGNSEFLNSSSHGAGRLLSRRDASKKISIEDFKESMKGIVGTVGISTLDEAPQAYKNIYDVMDAQKESVKILKHLKPIINWKGE